MSENQQRFQSELLQFLMWATLANTGMLIYLIHMLG